VAAVQSGQLGEEILDRAAERIVAMILKAEETLASDFDYDRAAHHALARRAAGEGAVLLRNEGAVLPLQEKTKIALVGRFAKSPRYQGAGSSLINPSQLDNLYDEIVTLVGDENLTYAPGYTKSGDKADEALIAEALEAAGSAGVVVICAGLTELYETEGLDRDHMKMPPGHDALIEAIAAAHSQVVVVLSNGSPVEMPWVDRVSGILEGYLGGQAGAGAIADILFGRVNPSGKLAETFPIKLEDNPSHHYFPAGPSTVEYRESLYVGYRYYDSVDQEVLFPFGHGLSYTTFEYSDLQLSRSHITDVDTLTATLRVKNTGTVAGMETVQLYVRDIETTVFRPEKELKGFAKIELQPGEGAEVAIELDRRAFAYYDTELKDWHVEAGVFEVLAGASSRDIRLSATVEVASTRQAAVTPDREGLAAYYNFPKGALVDQQSFETLLGRPVPPNDAPAKGSYTINTPVGDMTDTFVGRQLFGLMNRQMAKLIQGQEGTPTALLMEAMAREMPLRGMLMAADGSITREMLDALLVMINGRNLKGLSALIGAIRRR
jgi:beta-glucosidase